VILLLGMTGSGKSTSILYLSGCKMIKTLTKSQLSHITVDPKSEQNEEQKNITASPESKSETRYLSAVKVNINQDGDSIFLCDTPGFEDTNGAEVDIANGIGIIRGISKCSSVRPVILLSKTCQGDRLQGLKDIL
jgi:predicted GTPase